MIYRWKTFLLVTNGVIGALSAVHEHDGRCVDEWLSAGPAYLSPKIAHVLALELVLTAKSRYAKADAALVMHALTLYAQHGLLNGCMLPDFSFNTLFASLSLS